MHEVSAALDRAEKLLHADPARARELAVEALAAAAAAGLRALEARASSLAAYSSLHLGDPDLALGYARRAGAFKSLPEALRARLRNVEAIAHHQVGRYSEATRIFGTALRLARRSGKRGEIARSLGNIGIAHIEAGRSEEALGFLREALELLLPGPAAEGAAEAVDEALEPVIRADLGLALCRVGCPEETLLELEAAERLARQRRDGIALATILRVRGEALGLLGRREEAGAQLEEALALCVLNGLNLAGVRAAALLSGLRLDEGGLEEAEALIEDWLPRAAAGDLLRYAELLRLRGRLNSLRGRFRDAYADSERAGELERRSGAPAAAEAALVRERGSLRKRARRLSERVEGWSETVTKTLASLIEARDQRTGRHVDRSTEIVRLLGERLIERRAFGRFGAGSLASIVRMAPLHDIGKIAVPDSVLLKPGPLALEELSAMRRHVLVGRDILLEAARRVRYDSRVSIAADIAGYHHERWDGAGYPEGLAGEDIPLAARIVALADVYDAIRSERPYKPALSREQAADYIGSNADRHFDPRLVEAFADVEGRIAELYL